MWEIENTARDLWPELFKRKAVMLRAYKSADENGDGLIEEPEFSRLMLYMACYIELYADFEAIDTDGDRRLTEKEFISYYRKLGSKLSDDQLSRAFDQIDGNDGGMILFEEFCNYFAVERMKEMGLQLPKQAPKPKSKPAEKSGRENIASPATGSKDLGSVRSKLASPNLASRSNVVSPSQRRIVKKDAKMVQEMPGNPWKSLNANEVDALFARFDVNNSGK